jgi:PAS domain S-box-containing protein
MKKKSTSTRPKKGANKPQGKTAANMGINNTLLDPENWSLVALESAPFGVMVHDEKEKILLFNYQLEKISGYLKDEIPDLQTWMNKLYPDHDYRKLVLKERKRKIPKNRLRIRETIITRKDGEKRICEFSSILSSFGIRTVFIKDTNVLRETESSLKESEERFRLLSQATFEGILIHKDGVLLFANDQFFKMFGYEAQELLGKQMLPVCIAPQSLPFIKKHIRNGTSTPYEVTGLKKNGSTFPILIHAKSMEYQENEVRVAAIRDLSYMRQAESALRKSEERYTLATNAARVGVWDWDIQTNEFYLDPNVKAILGYSDAEIPNDLEVWSNYVHPDDKQPVMEAFQDHIDGKTPEFAYEHRMLHRDGSIRWIMARGTAIRDDQGNPVRVVGTDTDITQRKQAEEALLESEIKFRNLAEQSPNMILIIKNSKVIYANRKCEEITGYKSDELHSADFDFFRLIAPESVKLIKKNFKKHMSGEEVEPYEYTLIRKSDKRIEVIITTKLINYEGENAILGIFTDITERKNAEKALREKDNKLERQAKNLIEMNTALKVLLEQREKEKTNIKESLLADIKKLVYPYVEKLENKGLNEDAQTFVNIIKSNINDLISPLASNLSSKYFSLTPSEIQIADLIKHGKTSKEIASMLNVSPKAVSFHRGNLRKKLGLLNKKINLRTYLQNFPH